MGASVDVAVIAAAASVGGAVVSAMLAASFGERRAEKDARRAYEYEARKRLYETYEPLRVRLLDCADNAIRQLVVLAGPPSDERSTQSSALYRVNATAYFLLAPLVVARMVERRLNLVDLGLDKDIHIEYVIAKAIYSSLAEDAHLAGLPTALSYSPYVDDWLEKRKTCPEQYRRQGMPVGRLDTILDALHVARADGGDTLMSFGEYERSLYDLEPTDVSSGRGAARDLFVDFDPATRPVLWRILVVQAMLYWCLLEAMLGSALPQPSNVEARFVASPIYGQLCEALTRRDETDQTLLMGNIPAAASYFAERVSPALKRVQLLARTSR
jgi:hypothetical protein